MRDVRRRVLIGVAVIASVPLALGLAACGDDDGEAVRGGGASASGSGSDSGSVSGSGSASAQSEAPECVPVGDPAAASDTVAVTLGEWFIDMPSSIPAGTIAFEATNGFEPHELVIVRGVSIDELPLDEDGALDEDELPDGALVGEIEAFPAGETCTGVFEVPAGDYTFLCNIVEAEPSGGVESHLAHGMAISVSVV